MTINLASDLFRWSQKQSDEESVVIDDHELLPGGHIVEGQTFSIGSVEQMLGGGLWRFVHDVAQRVMEPAGIDGRCLLRLITHLL